VTNRPDRFFGSTTDETLFAADPAAGLLTRSQWILSWLLISPRFLSGVARVQPLGRYNWATPWISGFFWNESGSVFVLYTTGKSEAEKK